MKTPRKIVHNGAAAAQISRATKKPKSVLAQLKTALEDRYRNVWIHSAYKHTPAGKRIPTEYHVIANINRSAAITTTGVNTFLKKRLQELPPGVSFIRASYYPHMRLSAGWFKFRFKLTK